ncbi:MAG: hypothetical protein K6E27_02770 [Eubacterium sp.]|nr:hypothetical protein [Eubacterium sp.]
MSNGIGLRQNEEHSIEMLAAQRELYREAKIFNYLSVSMSVWIPFVLSIVLLFIPAYSPLGGVSYILSITSAILSFITDKVIRDKKKLAAMIQQKFDIYVYRMPWDERIFGKNKNLNDQIVTYSKRILNTYQERESLTNWYASSIDEKEINEAILACQRENVCWDVGLRKRFVKGIALIIILLCTLVFIMGIVRNESIIRLLWRLAFVAPMVKWLLSTVSQLRIDINDLDELDNSINESTIKSMEDLQDIQKCIFDHRTKSYIIPDFFYKLFKDSDEDRMSRIASMNRE